MAALLQVGLQRLAIPRQKAAVAIHLVEDVRRERVVERMLHQRLEQPRPAQEHRREMPRTPGLEPDHVVALQPLDMAAVGLEERVVEHESLLDLVDLEGAIAMGQRPVARAAHAKAFLHGTSVSSSVVCGLKLITVAPGASEAKASAAKPPIEVPVRTTLSNPAKTPSAASFSRWAISCGQRYQSLRRAITAMCDQPLSRTNLYAQGSRSGERSLTFERLSKLMTSRAWSRRMPTTAWFLSRV